MGGAPIAGAALGHAVGNDAVAAIDRTTRKPLSEAAVGGAPRRVAFDATGTVSIVADESGWVDLLR